MDYYPAMKQSAKTTLIVVAILLAIPFTCCGLPLGFLYATAPTTYVYELQGRDGYWGSDSQRHPDYTIGNLNLNAFLRGKEDYAGDHSGPRSFRFNVNLFDSKTRMMPDDITITLLDFVVDSNKGNIIASMSTDSLPFEMEFGTSDNFPNKAYWHDDRLFNPNLAASEIITVTMELEITQEGQTSLHTVIFVFQPRRIHSMLFFIPSV